MGKICHFLVPLALLVIYWTSETTAKTGESPTNIDPVSESKSAVAGEGFARDFKVRAPRHIPRNYCGRKGAYCFRTRNCCAGMCHGGICVAVDGDDPNYPKPTEPKGAATTAAPPSK